MSNNKTLLEIPFLRVYKPIVKNFGRDVAILIPELVYKQECLKLHGKTDIRGFFFYERHKLEKVTGLSSHCQKKAMNILVDLGLLEIHPEKKGIPPKTFYRFNIEKYNNTIIQLHESESKKPKSVIYRKVKKKKIND